MLALGSFFHYTGGFSKSVAADLSIPEYTAVGKVKDVLFSQPRLDFCAVVQAKKAVSSPHGATPRTAVDSDTNADTDTDVGARRERGGGREIRVKGRDKSRDQGETPGTLLLNTLQVERCAMLSILQFYILHFLYLNVIQVTSSNPI